MKVWPRDFSREDTFRLSQMVGCGDPLDITKGPFDPRVHYDASVAGGRWYFVAALKPNGSTPGKWCIGITPTGDPTLGPFVFYQVTSPNTVFPDQPQLGFSADKIIVTQNDFANHIGALLVLNKQEALRGNLLTSFIFS